MNLRELKSGSSTRVILQWLFYQHSSRFRLLMIVGMVGFTGLFAARRVHAIEDANPKGVSLAEKAEQVDGLLELWNKKDSPGASVAVVKDGQVIYSKGFGCCQLEYKIPITPQTVFHVASISKQFTAMAIAMLAEQGKLSLDDEIQKYVKQVPDFGEPITLRHLIHHTSGMRDQWELLAASGVRLDDVITQSHILSLIGNQRELNFKPGKQMMYCNSGYTLLAQVVKEVTGKSVNEWTRENVFEPLGMANTHFHDDHTEIVPNRAYSYAPAGRDKFRRAVLSYSNAGATSLFSTAEDLLLWMQNLESKQVGGSEVIEQMLERGTLNDGSKLDYAFGLMHGDHGGIKTISHSGADAGFRANMVWFPQQQLGIVVLSNLANFNPNVISGQIADIYLERPLTDYCGRYYSRELDTTYKIDCKDDKLAVSHLRVSPFDLTQIGGDRFRGGFFPFRNVKFERNEQGAIIGMTISGNRVRNLKFKRMSDNDDSESSDPGKSDANS